MQRIDLLLFIIVFICLLIDTLLFILFGPDNITIPNIVCIICIFILFFTKRVNSKFKNWSEKKINK